MRWSCKAGQMVVVGNKVKNHMHTNKLQCRCALHCIWYWAMYYICRRAQALNDITNMKAYQWGRGEGGAILPVHGTKQLCRVWKHPQMTIVFSCLFIHWNSPRISIYFMNATLTESGLARFIISAVWSGNTMASSERRWRVILVRRRSWTSCLVCLQENGCTDVCLNVHCKEK